MTGRIEAWQPRRPKNLEERSAGEDELFKQAIAVAEEYGVRTVLIDLANGRLYVKHSKTDAGQRFVRLRPALHDELAEMKARGNVTRSGDLVFPTREGKPSTATNVRRRVLAPAIELANELLEDRDAAPLPTGITPHSLRRTFASLLYAIGEPATVVMVEMGHTDPALALRIYAHAIGRSDDQAAQLKALVEGSEWADIGQTSQSDPRSAAAAASARGEKQAG